MRRPGDKLLLKIDAEEETVKIGSLSTGDFETCMATGSQLFPFQLVFTQPQLHFQVSFSPLAMINKKIWETSLSWHVKCSLPVAMCVSKTHQCA